MYDCAFELFQNNKRQNAKIIYNTALPVLFGVKYFADALWKVVEKRDIEVNANSELVEVNAKRNIATFVNVVDRSQRKEIEVEIQWTFH